MTWLTELSTPAPERRLEDATVEPTPRPTMEPTKWPTPAPTGAPTSWPTSSPTLAPTFLPTPAPTLREASLASGTTLQTTVALDVHPKVALHLWTSVNLDDLTVQVQATADGLPPALSHQVENMKMHVAL